MPSKVNGQAYLGDSADLIPDHHDKVNTTKKKVV